VIRLFAIVVLVSGLHVPIQHNKPHKTLAACQAAIPAYRQRLEKLFKRRKIVVREVGCGDVPN
jgi:hypothetical protein